VLRISGCGGYQVLHVHAAGHEVICQRARSVLLWDRHYSGTVRECPVVNSGGNRLAPSEPRPQVDQVGPMLWE
jgi:hypothetical protein